MSDWHLPNSTFIERHAEQRVRAALADTRIVALVGPRQAGKTTLARRIAEDDRRIYISLDDTQSRDFASEDPIGFVRDLSYAVIDEIQRVPNLILELKREVDESPEPGRFLITGSVDLFRTSISPDSLAGRVETVQLLPFSQAELEQLPEQQFVDRAFRRDFPTLEQTDSTSNLVDRILGGGYPLALSRTEPSRRRAWFQEYTRALTDRDVSDISNAYKRNEMARLVTFAALSSGQLVNFSRLGAQIGIDNHTADRWLDLFEHMFLLSRIPAWHKKGLKRLVKTPKLHFFDSGLLAATQNINTHELTNNRKLLGPILECFVYSELIKATSSSANQTNILHFRENSGHEVDFVLERSPREIVGIEVKASATVHPMDFRGLRQLAETVDRRFVCGIVLYDGDRIQEFARDLYAMPFSVLWSK